VTVVAVVRVTALLTNSPALFAPRVIVFATTVPPALLAALYAACANTLAELALSNPA
jgi:hypothetical protein